jgi:hypothetical protein
MSPLSCDFTEVLSPRTVAPMKAAFCQIDAAHARAFFPERCRDEVLQWRPAYRSVVEGT